jgi:hypothetical protein
MKDANNHFFAYHRQTCFAINNQGHVIISCGIFILFSRQIVSIGFHWKIISNLLSTALKQFPTRPTPLN